MVNAQLLAIGETMALVTPSTAIPLESAIDFHIDAAGAESNVAAHCAQMGVPSAWISAVGDDPLGRRITTTISERGVDTSRVLVNPTAPTGVYFKNPGVGVHYYRQQSAASLMGPEVLAGFSLSPGQVLHLSGITPALSAPCAHLVDAAIDHAREGGATVSFDVNYRPALWPVEVGAPVLRAISRRADIIFVGLDEAQELWGCQTPLEVRELFPFATLVVKNADVGATEFAGDDQVFVPAPTVEVVEVVGAGDAFAAGYLTAFLNEGAPSERLQAGHERAAKVLVSTSDFVPGA